MAEEGDGIRVFCLCRGLGDGYKSEGSNRGAEAAGPVKHQLRRKAARFSHARGRGERGKTEGQADAASVSDTQLTQPTTNYVEHSVRAR